MWKFGKSKKSTQEKLLQEALEEPAASTVVEGENSITKRVIFVILMLIVGFYFLGVYWSVEPDMFDVNVRTGRLLIFNRMQSWAGRLIISKIDNLANVALAWNF